MKTKYDPILQAYRQLHPLSRRTNSTAIVHSGSRQTIFDCVCGAIHTCSSWHRDSKHVSQWRTEHSDCMRRYIESVTVTG